ncbi:peptidoglycan DD-metalloendopeptidase family protein [Halovulum dunhuangense]|uniref:Peptidoglycan DD-metalloendopeptidase family protein n=2 Tax=Halovulum dunhuangense TaxID=1505036 RepID=A0A849L016_9RHOB|nr:peptidoglycan DD-metalloendopeptidase family protein [Halovulum dunhuangense]
MKGARAFVLLLVLAGPVHAQSLEARLDALREAEAAISTADTNIAQRRALGQAVRAYEQAEQALRTEIAAVAGRIRDRERVLEQERAGLRRLLGGVARMGSISEPLVLTGAASPIDGARAMLLMKRAAGAADLRARNAAAARDALEMLRARQDEALARITQTRGRLAEVRDTLIARADADRAATADIPDIGPDAANLAALAIALESATPSEEEIIELPFEPGGLALPVDGEIQRGFGEVDPAGVERPGLALAAPGGRLVTAPVPASVRFVGELDGYGRVVILEPGLNTLLVLAGMETVLVEPSELVGAGAPLGFLPGGGDHEEFLPVSGSDSGQPELKTLYMELRHDQRPVDPTPWIGSSD